MYITIKPTKEQNYLINLDKIVCITRLSNALHITLENEKHQVYFTSRNEAIRIFDEITEKLSEKK